MNSFVSFFVNLWNTVITALKQSTPIPVTPPIVTPTPSGPVVVAPTLRDKLITLITHENGAKGPFPGTGGQIFQDSPAIIATIADCTIAAQQPDEGVTVELMTALLRQESDFSVLARDPNDSTPLPPGETRDDLTDIGLDQITERNFSGFADLQGMTRAEQIATVEDPTWALPVLSQMLATRLAWAKKVDAQIRAAGITPAYGDDYRLMALTSYNVGCSGAAIRAVLQHLDIVEVDSNSNVVALPTNFGPLLHTTILARALYPKVSLPWPQFVSFLKTQPPDPFTYGFQVLDRAAQYKTVLGQ